jgi:hypothetical protein
MNQPEQQQIDHWLNNSRYQLDRAWRLNKEGFHEKHDVTLQSVYRGVALDHASLARAKFLNGDPIRDVRAEFANAARCVLKSFTMAYDRSDPDYVGDKWPAKNPNYTGHKDSPIEAKWLDPVYGQVDWSCVSETTAIDGFNFALMAADFDLAAKLAGWFQDPGDGVLMDVEANHYAHALAQTLRGERTPAWNTMKAQREAYEAKPSKRNDYRKNYYTLSTALFGILVKDTAIFNKGLAMQLDFYQGDAQGENKNTDEEFICDHAVALANLGLHHGLAVTVEHDTLPKGLLI